jgi:hypothetical protein
VSTSPPNIIGCPCWIINRSTHTLPLGCMGAGTEMCYCRPFHSSQLICCLFPCHLGCTDSYLFICALFLCYGYLPLLVHMLYLSHPVESIPLRISRGSLHRADFQQSSFADACMPSAPKEADLRTSGEMLFVKKH